MQAESSAGLAERQQIAQHLLKAQRTSGGWAQRPEWPSDDYGTGMSLWVLNEAGILRSDDPRFRRGARFLVSTHKVPMDHGTSSAGPPDSSPTLKAVFRTGATSDILQASLSGASESLRIGTPGHDGIGGQPGTGLCVREQVRRERTPRARGLRFL
jgi:hypothetical protein